MFKAILLFVVIFIAVEGLGIGTLLSDLGPKYESYLCALRTNFSVGFLSCKEDCQLSHGANEGYCLDPDHISRYNCFCTPPTGRLPVREQQCILRNDGFDKFCDLDCKCNHGAIGGRCDFDHKACVCHGSNTRNEGCPAKSFEHFKELGRIIFHQRSGTQGPAWLYLPGIPE